METENEKISNEQFKNLVDCYYLLLKKFKKKSSYVLDEFFAKEKKEKTGILSIYEDVDVDAFHYFILSLLDSEYDNANPFLKALCFYMDSVKIQDLLRKNVKASKTKIAYDDINTKSPMKKSEKQNDEKTNEMGTAKNKKVICDIKSLSIFNSNLNSNGILFLAKSLYGNEYSKLEHLSIDCNVLASECIKFLSLSLCNYNNLKSLSLQYCNLKNDSIKYIIDIIVYINSSLSVLNLCGNHFTEEGMTKLFESFLLNNALTTIDVSYNMFTFSPAFVDILGKVIANTTNITAILATGNFIETDNLEKINEAMNSNKSIATLKLPKGVNDELLQQIKQKLIRAKKKKKTQGNGKEKGKKKGMEV